MNPELEDLLTRAMESEADAAQITRLAEILKADPAAREWATAQMALHGALQVLLEDEVTRERSIRRQIEAIADDDGRRFAAGVRGRLSRRRITGRILATAAVLLLGLAGALLFTGRKSPPIVATFIRAENVEWDGPAPASLRAGETLKLRDGLVELDIAGKGRLIVEGPAALDFPDERSAFLHRGRLVMRATPKGVGFRIDTPQGRIIDLGTEFGISVDDGGGVETHVIEGQIKAEPRQGGSILLHQEDAMRFDEGQGRKITARPGDFYTGLPPSRPASPDYIHWGFDEADGEFATAEGLLAENVRDAGRMRLFGRSDRWIQGPRGSALHCDGESVFGETHFRGIGEGNPRTVCFWLKVPADFRRNQGYGIISWGQTRMTGGAWQISVNPEPADGQVGRIRVGLFGGQVVGSRDLRDDQWHHIAVVLYGGSHPNVGTHVLMYVDGTPEKISGRALQVVRTAVSGSEHGVWVGRNVWFARSLKNSEFFAGRYFRGGVDELYIFNAALNAEDIRKLMHHQVPGTD